MAIRRPFIDAVIPIKPKGKGRPRFNRRTGHVYTPAETRKWAASCAAVLAQHTPREPHAGPLVMDVLFVMQRPAYMNKKDRYGNHKYPTGMAWHTKKPDMDNLWKNIKDVATTVRWWTDDCVVSCGMLLKATAEMGGSPRLEIMVSEVTQTPEEIWQTCRNLRDTTAR